MLKKSYKFENNGIRLTILFCLLLVCISVLHADSPIDVNIVINGNDIDLSWSDPASADKYYIYRSEDAYTGFTIIDSSTTTEYTDTGAGAVSAKYFYYVTAEGTSGCGTVTDIDGNVYQTVQIGNQCWIVENLKVTHYRNGDAITHITSDTAWANASSGAYCYFNNDPTNIEDYGNLYNWFAVNDSRGLAPQGWHVATDDDWKQMEMYLGMTQAQADSMDYRGTTEGAMLKEGGTEHWFMEECGDPLCVCPDNSSGCNCSGFTARGGGFRHFMGGTYVDLTFWGQFWTSTEYDSTSAMHREIDCNVTTIMRYNAPFRLGFSVRCVKTVK